MESAPTPTQTPAPSQSSTEAIPQAPALTSSNSEPVINTTWTKTIPILNIVAMVIMLGFGVLDTSIAISSPDLRPFGVPMLFAGAIFLGFMYLENFVYKPRFADSDKHLDTAILVMIIIRNTILVLNVIPFIQLIGLLLAIPVGIPVLVVHMILIHEKKKSIKAVA